MFLAYVDNTEETIIDPELLEGPRARSSGLCLRHGPRATGPHHQLPFSAVPSQAQGHPNPLTSVLKHPKNCDVQTEYLKSGTIRLDWCHISLLGSFQKRLLLFGTWGKLINCFPAGMDKAPPPPQDLLSWSQMENLRALSGPRWGSICPILFLNST